jgi:flagellar basal body rod protein FlgC
MSQKHRPTKLCTGCNQIKPLTQFYHWKYSPDGKLPYCKKCKVTKIVNETTRDPRVLTRERLYNSSRVRAEKIGIEHTILPDDIPTPTHCIYLGTKLEYRIKEERGDLMRRNTPSIDRIDNSRGYVPGNVQVISWMANTMKSNASFEDLISFAEAVLRIHGKKG